MALATDTGSFKFDLTTPAVHELAARLLATGIRPAEISRRMFDSRPFGAMKLSVRCSARAELEPAAARPGHGVRHMRPWPTCAGTTSGRTYWTR